LHIHGHGYTNYGVIDYLKGMDPFMVMFNIDYETMIRTTNMLNFTHHESSTRM